MSNNDFRSFVRHSFEVVYGSEPSSESIEYWSTIGALCRYEVAFRMASNRVDNSSVVTALEEGGFFCKAREPLLSIIEIVANAGTSEPSFSNIKNLLNYALNAKLGRADIIKHSYGSYTSNLPFQIRAQYLFDKTVNAVFRRTTGRGGAIYDRKRLLSGLQQLNDIRTARIQEILIRVSLIAAYS